MKSIFEKKLSVVIPCYNENSTISKIIKKVIDTNLNLELILVDDFSTDGSRKKIKQAQHKVIKKKIFHNKNKGKGACIKSALRYVSGELVIIQDADLEYNPKDYKKLLTPFLEDKVEVVYGSRVLNKKRYSLKKKLSVNFRTFSNHALTILSNILNNQSLTDAHTCYKIFKTKLLKKIKPKENDFAFCPEVTTKISNLNLNIKEVPIHYKSRGYDEGKKIGIYDAFRVLIVIFKYKF
ncbi:glycosyltransferase family 2 protein [Candidatus Pelagibacter ubique]|nr:glycosyltransferase family 2 protein [Candidatus Pelagibacter ubique]